MWKPYSPFRKKEKYFLNVGGIIYVQNDIFLEWLIAENDASGGGSVIVRSAQASCTALLVRLRQGGCQAPPAALLLAVSCLGFFNDAFGCSGT